jgi:beta-phosphoglucomutase-like phosphatase (HAD superfamily)
METIEAVLLEPVGCLAEFPAGPFLEIAARLSGRKQTSRSGSRAYWHLLNLMEASGCPSIERYEIEAVEAAVIYEDVSPALSQLKAMGVRRIIASSFCNAAIARFLERCPDLEVDGIWNRDTAGGIKAAPLVQALKGASLRPERTMFLTDTAEGLKVAASAGVHAILMMNDPDESRRLAAHNPAGGIVSLHELPDFIRFVRAKKHPATL